MERESEALWEFAFAEAPLLYARFSSDETLVEANPHTLALQGGSIEGRTIRDVFVDFRSTLTLARLAETDGGRHRLDVNVAGSTPETYSVRVLRVGDGFLCLGGPDTEVIAELNRQILALYRDVANMTRELSKANAELERLDALKNQFLGMAAHDLRGPIGLVMNYTEFLMDGLQQSLSSEQADDFGVVLQACTRMRSLIDDFLDLSTIASGRLQILRESVSIDALVEESVRLARLRAERRQTMIHVELQLGRSTVEGDHPKLVQVLCNVLNNAVDHSPDGSTVRLEGREEADNVCLRVIDQGTGIPEDMLAVIDEPFVTTGRARGKDGGYGLGLAIARRVLDAHGGALRVEHTGPTGTTICVCIPIGDTEKGFVEHV